MNNETGAKTNWNALHNWDKTQEKLHESAPYILIVIIGNVGAHQSLETATLLLSPVIRARSAVLGFLLFALRLNGILLLLRVMRNSELHATATGVKPALRSSEMSKQDRKRQRATFLRRNETTGMEASCEAETAAARRRALHNPRGCQQSAAIRLGSHANRKTVTPVTEHGI